MTFNTVLTHLGSEASIYVITNYVASLVIENIRRIKIANHRDLNQILGTIDVF